MEGDFKERLAKNEMHRADRRVEKRDVSDLRRRDDEDRADEKLLDVGIRCTRRNTRASSSRVSFSWRYAGSTPSRT